MIRFQQTFGAHTGRICELDQDVISFGRLPECDVAFDPQADLDASGRHAEVRREGQQWMVVDAGSRNGTWLNGQRVQRAVLSSGDELEFGLGGPRLKVEIASPGGPRMTGPMTPARPDQPTAAATPIPPVAAQGQRGIDTNAPTMMAESQPPRGGGALQTPIPMSSPPAPLGGWSSSPATHDHAPRHADASSPSVPDATPAAPTPAPAHLGGRDASSPGLGSDGGDKKFGQKTVAMMIQSAVAQSREEKEQGGNRSTAFLRAIASEAATSSSRGLRIAVVVLSVLFLLSVAAIVTLVIMNMREAEAARQRDVQLQNQVAQGPAGARIAAAYNGAIYLLVEQMPAGEANGLCTAFAVRNDLLATNAHCVVAMERRQPLGATYSALPNGAEGTALDIVQMWRHPGYQPEGDNPSADVGIVQVSGELPVSVSLGSMQQVQQLQVGDDIFVYGFPGDLVNVQSPVATITNGVVGRMVAFDGSAADFATAQLIQHSAFTSPGTSGSPVFNRDGVVIGINAGTFRSAQQQQVMGPLGPHTQTVVTESGYKYGVRIDLLTSLLAGMNR